MDIKLLQKHLTNALSEGLGLDLTDPNLAETPTRIAKMWHNEFFSNCCSEFADFKTFPNIHGYDQIVALDKIHFTSTCSHHFLPFTGLAWIFYIPADTLIGASKMARIVEHYSHRPQLQENLCHEVLKAIIEGLDPRGAMVVMRAVHGCMECRGVKQYDGAGMATSAIYGMFVEPSIKAEAMGLLELSLKM